MIFRRNTHLLLTLGLPFSLGLAACTGDDGASTSDSETVGTMPTTASTMSTTASTSGTAAETETSGGSDTASGSGTSTGTTTGETGGGLDATCEAYCNKGVECELPDVVPLEECIAECVEGFASNPACEAVIVDYLGCELALPCEEFEESTDCLFEYSEEIGAACPSCDGSAEEGAESCGFTYTCTDGKVEELSCGPDGCVCLENGVEVGSCDNDICSAEVSFSDLRDKAESCCGF